ncbi:hypothetical protein [Ruegeria atlantica]|uniref:hypothetical protein n=1 Tax=Ruegeria atlantica TaxID=81569 RepID=UPI002494DDFF|nr:hypothetical protein [Ruegeria atlantica]
MPRELDLADRIRAANMLKCALVVHSESEVQGLRDVARRNGLTMPPITLRPLTDVKGRQADGAN